MNSKMRNEMGYQKCLMIMLNLIYKHRILNNLQILYMLF